MLAVGFSLGPNQTEEQKLTVSISWVTADYFTSLQMFSSGSFIKHGPLFKKQQTNANSPSGPRCLHVFCSLSDARVITWMGHPHNAIDSRYAAAVYLFSSLIKELFV